MYWPAVVLYDVVRVHVCRELTKRRKKFQREAKLPNYIYYCMCIQSTNRVCEKKFERSFGCLGCHKEVDTFFNSFDHFISF
jgi:hypothetical protein